MASASRGRHHWATCVHSRRVVEQCVCAQHGWGGRASDDYARFEVFDAATAAIEAHRPCTVSCAYIVAFAARDAAYLASGVDYSVPAGRRDGRASLEPEPLNHIPLPNVRDRFADKGLSLDDIVALSGTNSIGRSHCTSFAPRLYNFSAARPQDHGRQ
ncbi:peroxidase 5-like [Musa acuminata AAA Group]|uniref:peroxidase 5-like n=1 Tax=Musa acuminata AAA Group TaxID=214697 RepID=UPI0031D6214E